MEFVAREPTLRNLPNNSYTDFRLCFNQESNLSPQIVLLAEFVKESAESGATSANLIAEGIKPVYDDLMSHVYQDIFIEIANNQNAFRKDCQTGNCRIWKKTKICNPTKKYDV